MTKPPTHPPPDSLEAAYREMAADAVREREAMAWSEGLIGDVGDLTGSDR